MEAATVIRTIADIQDISVNKDQKTVTVHATPVQVAVSEWLFSELDTPPPRSAVSHEYRVPGSADDLVRIFYVPYAPTVQDFQRAATRIREAAQIRKIFTYNTPRAVALRGTAQQIAQAVRLAQELDKP